MNIKYKTKSSFQFKLKAVFNLKYKIYIYVYISCFNEIQAAYKVMHSNHGKTGIIFHRFPSSQTKKKKKLVFLGSKTEFYQRLKVEDNTICFGYVFWAVRFGLTIWAYLI